MKFIILILSAVLAFSYGNEATKRKNTPKNMAEQLKLDFQNSVLQLIQSFNLKSKSVQRPGLAKVFREESDRKWDRALITTQKFFQRGHESNSTFKDELGQILVTFEHINGFAPQDKTTPYVNYYFARVNDLKTESKASSKKININYKNDKHYDADMADFWKKLAKDEEEYTRKFRVMDTNLKKIGAEEKINGAGMSLFDQSLL